MRALSEVLVIEPQTVKTEAEIRAALEAERMEWERDQAAIAHYEAWYADKTAAEADAEQLAVRGRE